MTARQENPTRPLDPTFRDALRAELVHTVHTVTPATEANSRRPRRRSSRRRTLTLSGVLLVGLAGGGVAVASGVLPMPGADDVVLRSPASTVVHTGTATVDLGRRPAGTTSVELTLTCLTPGTFSFADGANMTCSSEDIARNARDNNPATSSRATTPGLPDAPGSAGYTLPLAAGQTSTTITATAGAQWSLTTAYSTRTPTDWAVSANGDTYGVIKDCSSKPVVQEGECEPDLIAVLATNKRLGYVYAGDLDNTPDFTSPEQALEWQANRPAGPRAIPVFASDGTTVIGEFQVG